MLVLKACERGSFLKLSLIKGGKVVAFLSKCRGKGLELGVDPPRMALCRVTTPRRDRAYKTLI